MTIGRMRFAIALSLLFAAFPADAEPKRAPTPRTAVVVVSELPASQRKHDRWWYERARERCERRATEWARVRCLRGIAR
jgi:hypothetical protein